MGCRYDNYGCRYDNWDCRSDNSRLFLTFFSFLGKIALPFDNGERLLDGRSYHL